MHALSHGEGQCPREAACEGGGALARARAPKRNPAETLTSSQMWGGPPPLRGMSCARCWDHSMPPEAD